MKRAVKYALPLVALTTIGLDDDVALGGIFIKIGDIEGESKDSAHLDEIDVLAWSWGVSSVTDPAGGGPPDVPFSDNKIIKGYDKSSPSILLACANGTPIQDATISVTREIQGNFEDYPIIKLSDVLVTKIANGGKDETENVSETVSLNFAKIEFTYKEFDAAGKQVGIIESCFDVLANKEC